MTHPTIDLCVAGRISPAVALARLVLDGFAPERIEGLLPAHSAITDLFAAQRGNLDSLAQMLAESGACHDASDPGGTDVAAIARMFDRAVALSPEASVAAYCLGDEALLATATGELVEWLLAERLARPQTDALDLGCGIGRVAAALAPHVRTVLGLDISSGMIAEARRRHCADNLRFEQTDGLPADNLAKASFDLVLAVDSMPYLIQVGIASPHVASAGSVLRAGGGLVVCNLSYRGDDAADAVTAREWATQFDLRLTACGERPFRLWDGSIFVFRKRN